MTKKDPTSRPWWKNDLFIGALSMLVILIATEILFSLPSRWLHSHSVDKIDIRQPPVGDPRSDNNAYCTREYAPVCGADGKTYNNSCLANAAKTIVASEGTCVTPLSQSGSENTLPDETHSGDVDNAVRPVTNEDYTDTKKFHIYTNTRVGYSMSFPAYCYYQGYTGQDGAIHSMVMGLNEADVSNFASAPVRIWFYKTPPSVPPSARSITLTNGILYIASSSDEPKIRKVVNDILASAQ